MTPLEIAMAFLLGLTLLSGVSILLPGDPMRLTRVLLAVASALVFQLHVLLEGTQPGHAWLYAAGLVVLVLVAGQWLLAQRGAQAERGDDDA